MEHSVTAWVGFEAEVPCVLAATDLACEFILVPAHDYRTVHFIRELSDLGATASVTAGDARGGWHDFRHTLTTWALKKFPPKVVSEMLGHASIKTTLDIYGHVLQEDFEEPHLRKWPGSCFTMLPKMQGLRLRLEYLSLFQVFGAESGS